MYVKKCWNAECSIRYLLRSGIDIDDKERPRRNEKKWKIKVRMRKRMKGFTR
jgi:hypothetical protein